MVDIDLLLLLQLLAAADGCPRMAMYCNRDPAP
jgi:hypothetical protein